MPNSVTRLATYDDLLNLPDHIVGEIISGVLISHPRPAPRHALAASALGSTIFERYDRNSPDGPGGWWIIDEPECHLGNDVLVPDIAGWRQSTLPELPTLAWFDVAPDWVCEIISPSTHKHDRSTKRDIYAREGIAHYWIVDPVEQLIEVFALLDGQWTLAATAKDLEVIALAPFEEFQIALGRLWT